MHKRRLKLLLSVTLAAGLWLVPPVPGQEPAPSEAPPPIPQGVEVMARGPVHEAFATPTSEAAPTKPVPKPPPQPLEEMPPQEKPEGDMNWIAGYWAWDDDRNDYLWVSGIWRTAPPGKHWVAGYWRDDNGQSVWVPGFWTASAPPAANAPQDAAVQQVTYLPAPPAPPEIASPGQAPTPESFYVPGQWVWTGTTYAWQAGYWARVQPGYVWVPSHYRWTPGGYIFIPGYWDLGVARRGVLYAPVVVNTVVVGPRFVYTPAYVVRDTIVLDALFVRPCYCHYYFGDYYGPVYRERGFESCVVYSRRHYDSIIVYERYEHRADPHWETVQVNICLDRHAGRAPLPPRTLVQQNITIVNNTKVVNDTQVLVPSSQLAAAKGIRTVQLDNTARVQAQQHARVVQQVAQQRTQAEIKPPPGKPFQPRVASLNVPAAHPGATAAPAAGAAKPGTPAAQAPAHPAGAPAGAQPAHGAAPPAPGTPGAHPGAVPPTTPKTPPKGPPPKPMPPKKDEKPPAKKPPPKDPPG